MNQHAARSNRPEAFFDWCGTTATPPSASA
jgi:hypothetical protein